MLSTQLSELGFETRKIVVRPAKDDKPEVALTVRGISAEDVMRLVQIHGPAMSKLFNQITSKEVAIDLDNTARIATVLLNQAPDIVADLLLIATDEMDVNKGFEVAKRLPIPVQLNALEAIAELTFIDGGSVGEMIGTVTKMLAGTNGLVKNLAGLPASKASQAG